MSITSMNKIISSITTDMHRQRNHKIADDLESVRSVIDHLRIASTESPALQPMLDDAAKDIVQLALSHETMSQGSSALWPVVLKHLLQKVGDLAAKVENQRHESPNDKSFQRPKRDFKNKEKEFTKRKYCRNCLAAQPSQRIYHSLHECQSHVGSGVLFNALQRSFRSGLSSNRGGVHPLT